MKQAAVLWEQVVKPKMHEKQGMKKAAAETRSVGFHWPCKHQYRRRPANAAAANADVSGGATPTFAWWRGQKGPVPRNLEGTRDASPGQLGLSGWSRGAF